MKPDHDLSNGNALCPVCGKPGRICCRASNTVMTWHCDNPQCRRIGSFSEHVWPEPGGNFTRLCDLSDRRLHAAIGTAALALPELEQPLRDEVSRRIDGCIKRGLENDEGTEAPTFSARRDQRPSEPPEAMP